MKWIDLLNVSVTNVLVGLAWVREMVPIMAGHTRGAYAARTATMQGSKEIDDKGFDVGQHSRRKTDDFCP